MKTKTGNNISAALCYQLDHYLLSTHAQAKSQLFMWMQHGPRQWASASRQKLGSLALQANAGPQGV